MTATAKLASIPEAKDIAATEALFILGFHVTQSKEGKAEFYNSVSFSGNDADGNEYHVSVIIATHPELLLAKQANEKLVAAFIESKRRVIPVTNAAFRLKGRKAKDGKAELATLVRSNVAEQIGLHFDQATQPKAISIHGIDTVLA